MGKNRRVVAPRLARAVRANVAVTFGSLSRDASKLLGRGTGGMIGGRVALSIDPGTISYLSRGRRAAIITGTNGKSTTTKMVRAALQTAGPVASNIHGDNMPAGICTALMNNRKAPYAALEVDEMYTPQVADAVRPEVLVLLNLSHDQLDRVGEISSVESRLREAVNANPEAHVVANCDDPLIVSAAWDAPKVTWVSAGASWGADSATFPRGGGRVVWEAGDWVVEDNPEYRRPEPEWWVSKEPGGATLRGPGGTELPLQLSLPGDVNLGNAAMAVSAAVTLGIPAAQAVAAVGLVSDVAGRYQRFDVDGRVVRLLLAKNPAGWQEALSMVSPSSTQTIIATNGQLGDGADLSWLWDVDFRALPVGEQLFASGDRNADLAVRLDYEGLTPELVDDPLDAVRRCQPGEVELLANYTAFRDLLGALKQAGFMPIRSSAGGPNE